MLVFFQTFLHDHVSWSCNDHLVLYITENTHGYGLAPPPLPPIMIYMHTMASRWEMELSLQIGCFFRSYTSLCTFRVTSGIHALCMYAYMCD